MSLEWLPDLTAWDPADFGAASGMGTLLVAIAATLIARRQLKQARQLREEEAAPAIIVDIVPDDVSGHLLDLVIENIGKTPARDVTIRFDPPVKSAADMSDYELADWSPLKDGLKTLAPGRRLTAMFDSAIERYGTDLPRRYEVTVDCLDSHGRRQPTMQYTLDMEPLYGALHTEVRGMHQLVKEVEKLRKALEPIAKKGITVETFDGEAVVAKRAAAHEEHRERVRAFQERQAAREAEAASADDGGGDHSAPTSS